MQTRKILGLDLGIIGKTKCTTIPNEMYKISDFLLFVQVGSFDILKY